MKFAAIDCETSGLNPEVHEILSLSIILLNGEFEPEDKVPPFNIQIKATRAVDAAALQVNGLNPNKGVSINEAEKAFVEWMSIHNIDDSVIPIGYNVNFDIAFIKKHLPEIAGRFSHHHRDVMQLVEIVNDLHQIKKGYKMFESCSLSKVLETLGMSAEGSHNALIDAKNTAKVYRHMLGML